MWSSTEAFACALKVAVTVVFAVRVRLHVLVPLHAPDHPANEDVLLAAAVSVTTVPFAKLALHVCPQFTPMGLLVTVPAPLPELCTLNCTELLEEFEFLV